MQARDTTIKVLTAVELGWNLLWAGRNGKYQNKILENKENICSDQKTFYERLIVEKMMLGWCEDAEILTGVARRLDLTSTQVAAKSFKRFGVGGRYCRVSSNRVPPFRS